MTGVESYMLFFFAVIWFISHALADVYISWFDLDAFDFYRLVDP